MKLFELFMQSVKREALFSPSDLLLVAVSGGVDSVVLCDLLHRGGFAFEMAHCNFRLRGEESDADEAFVRAMGERMGRKVHVMSFDTKAVAHDRGISVQEAARDLRREGQVLAAFVCQWHVVGIRQDRANDWVAASGTG